MGKFINLAVSENKHMRNLFIKPATILAILFTTFVSSAQTSTVNYSLLENAPHPRLFIGKDGIEVLRNAIAESPNPYFPVLHNMEMAAADKYVRENKALIYTKDISGRRILSVSRDALLRIFAASYAYIATSDEQYVHYVESILGMVCSFPDWNPSHYLDTAEMGMAVAIAYDWLYDVLDPEIRSLAEKTLYERVIVTSLDPSDKYASTRCTSPMNNWNQVCNAGVLASGVALFDICPAQGKEIIERCIKYNARAAGHMYAPDGVYPEGAGYWTYGTTFQIAINSILTNIFGTDFGLSDLPGFAKTCRYMMYAQSNLGACFDYADTGGTGSCIPQAWYFAERFDDPECLYLLKKALEKNTAKTNDRMYPLYLIYASRCRIGEIREPAERLFLGYGSIPIAIARTGWDRKDAYLGIKAGQGGYNHGHLDVGSFVFEADGVRWASEFHTVGGYSRIEKELKRIGGGSLFNSKPDSWRWKIFSYSNFDHSTLSVNGKIHDPYAVGNITETFDKPDALGATVDLTPLFGGDLVKASRTVLIKGESVLEITDIVEAPADRDAEVKFTLVSDASAEAGRKGITLTSEEQYRTLKVKGASVRFQTWSTEPSDYPNEVNSTLKGQKNKSKSGYTYTVPAGKTLTVVTTLK